MDDIRLNIEHSLLYLLFKQYMNEDDPTTFKEWLLKNSLLEKPILNDLQKLWKKHNINEI